MGADGEYRGSGPEGIYESPTPNFDPADPESVPDNDFDEDRDG